MGDYLSFSFSRPSEESIQEILAPVFAGGFFQPIAVGAVEGHSSGDHWFLAGYALEDFLERYLERGIPRPASVAMASSQEPAVQRIVGTGDDLGKLLGLERDWLARAIRATGNYGEIFERHLGRNTPLALPRGLNSLWNKGGLHYALPVR